MTAVQQLALTVTWDPTIRGILVVLVGVVVLMGSVYLLLATNTGSRLGFLLAAAGLSGWMSIMGMVWWIYGIGYVGETPTWQVREVVTSSEADQLDGAQLTEAQDLDQWNRLPEGDTKRGEAQAAADEALTGEDSRLSSFESTADYTVVDAYDKGGKSGFAENIPGPHPPRYAIVQVQPVIPVVTLENPDDPCPEGSKCIAFGETPPPAAPNPEAQISSVVMIRDLGSRRLPPAMITLASLLVFGVVCNVLHRRDKLVAEHRDLAVQG